MDEDENQEQIYVRTPEDSKSIIQHAKLNSKKLTEVTQALYYPSADIVADNLKLLELDEHILGQIRSGERLCFKGGRGEKVVLCTDEKTYDVKAAETSNSLLVVPGLKFGQETSKSPLKSPRTGNIYLDRSLDDSDTEIEVQRALEHRNVLTIFHEYFECREIKPRFRKIYELLQLTRYSGPENEEFIDKKLLFTFDQLLDTVQSSRMQFMEGLVRYRAIFFEGHMRMLDYEYEYRIVNIMVGLISENSWPLGEIDRGETIAALNGIAPRSVVESLFDLYATPTESKFDKYTYNEEMVARIVAQNILQPSLKFRVDEFMATWQDALPEGMQCHERYLRGLGIFDKEGQMTCIRSLVEDNLSTNIHDRMRILFRTKTRWTLDEIEPYIEYFATPTVSVTSLLAKHSRSLEENGVRYYMTKH